MKRRYVVPVVVAITALSGFCSLVYQVVWDRTVKYNFGGDSISSAIVTGTFLLGLGLGAYLFGRRWRDAYRTYALVELAIGGFGILSFYLISPVAATLAQVLKATPEQVEGLRPAVVVGCILLLLPPCTLIGGTLPLMLECFVKPLRFSARSIGFIYGVNTLGASVGILAVPLLFLNRLSLPHTLWIVGGINMALGLLILLWARRRLGGAGRDAGASLEAAGAPLETAGAPLEAAGSSLEAGGSSLEAGAPLEMAGAPLEAAGVSSETAGVPAAERRLQGLAYGLAFVSGFVALGFEVSLFRAFQIVNPSSAYNFPLVLVLFLLALATGSIVFTRGELYLMTDMRRLKT